MHEEMLCMVSAGTNADADAWGAMLVDASA